MLRVRSLSLRSNSSLDRVHVELDRLKRSIDDSLQAALPPPRRSTQRTSDRSEARISRNLRDLAQAATRFHVAATSTAVSIRAEGSTPAWTSRQKSTPSVVNSIYPRSPPVFRPDLEEDVSAAASIRDSIAVPNPPTQPGECSFVATTQPVDQVPVAGGIFGASVADIGFQIPVVEVLEEFASESMKHRNFVAAAGFLEKAIAAHRHPQDKLSRSLRIRLATCQFFLRQWKEAEPLADWLKSCDFPLDMDSCNLMHALAIAQLREYSFARAIETCTMALNAKLKLVNQQDPETLETMGLLATIFDMSGDFIRHEGVRRSIPPSFKYCHPTSELEFIATRTNLLPATVNAADILADRVDFIGLAELDGSSDVIAAARNPLLGRSKSVDSGLMGAMRRHAMLEMDTSKVVVDEERTLPLSGRTAIPTRKMTRLLRGSMIRRSNSDPNPQGNQTGRPRAAESWFKLARPKTVLRKRSSVKPSRSLREKAKRNMAWLWKASRGSGEDIKQPDADIMAWVRSEPSWDAASISPTIGSDDSGYHSEESPTCPVVEQPDYFSLPHLDTPPLTRPVYPTPNCIQRTQELWDTQIYELPDTSPRAELQDTGLSHVDIIAMHNYFGPSSLKKSWSRISHGSTSRSSISQPDYDEGYNESAEDTAEEYHSQLSPQEAMYATFPPPLQDGDCQPWTAPISVPEIAIFPHTDSTSGSSAIPPWDPQPDLHFLGSSLSGLFGLSRTNSRHLSDAVSPMSSRNPSPIHEATQKSGKISVSTRSISPVASDVSDGTPETGLRPSTIPGPLSLVTERSTTPIFDRPDPTTVEHVGFKRPTTPTPIASARKPHYSDNIPSEDSNFSLVPANDSSCSAKDSPESSHLSQITRVPTVKLRRTWSWIAGDDARVIMLGPK